MPTEAKAKAPITTEIEQQPTELRCAQITIEETDCPVALPYWPTWAAAQFASVDPAKQLLAFVHVWRDANTVQIESTDGHRAFRYRLPAATSDGPTLWRVPEQGLLLHAKPLRKVVTAAQLLTVTRDLKAVFHGGKKGLLELSSVNCAGVYSVNTLEDCSKVGTYPDINQLWPDNFSNTPGAPWSFSARYLKEWAAVVEKLSDHCTITFKGNGPTTPFILTSRYDGCIGQHYSDAKLELLLMPVQVRN